MTDDNTKRRRIVYRDSSSSSSSGSSSSLSTSSSFSASSSSSTGVSGVSGASGESGASEQEEEEESVSWLEALSPKDTLLICSFVVGDYESTFALFSCNRHLKAIVRLFVCDHLEDLVIHTRHQLRWAQRLVKSIGIPRRLKRISFTVIHNLDDRPRPGHDHLSRQANNEEWTRVCESIVDLSLLLLPVNRATLESLTPWVSVPLGPFRRAEKRLAAFDNLATVEVSADVSFEVPRCRPSLVDSRNGEINDHATDTARNLLLGCGQSLVTLRIDQSFSFFDDGDIDIWFEWLRTFLSSLYSEVEKSLRPKKSSRISRASSSLTTTIGSGYFSNLKTLIIDADLCPLLQEDDDPVIGLLSLPPLALTLHHFELSCSVVQGWWDDVADDLGDALSNLQVLDTLILFLDDDLPYIDDNNVPNDNVKPWHLPKLTSLRFHAPVGTKPRIIAPLLVQSSSSSSSLSSLATSSSSDSSSSSSSASSSSFSSSSAIAHSLSSR